MGALRSTSVRSVSVRTTPNPEVRHSELVWDLDSGQGPAVARFRIEYDGEVLRDSAYRNDPTAGSPLPAGMLEGPMRQ